MQASAEATTKWKFKAQERFHVVTFMRFQLIFLALSDL
jgi:hypothetical protein